MDPGVDPYWLVHNPQHGQPSKRHPSADAAHAEAQRIALRHPGDVVYVLSVEAAYRVPAPQPERLHVRGAR